MRFNDLTLRSKHVYLHGIGESQVESMFKEIMEEYTIQRWPLIVMRMVYILE